MKLPPLDRLDDLLHQLKEEQCNFTVHKDSQLVTLLKELCQTIERIRNYIASVRKI
jgi:hypothetical protein